MKNSNGLGHPFILPCYRGKLRNKQIDLRTIIGLVQYYFNHSTQRVPTQLFVTPFNDPRTKIINLFK